MIKYIYKTEIVCGKEFYMIYVRILGIFDYFFERWNTYDTVRIRLNELNNKK